MKKKRLQDDDKLASKLGGFLSDNICINLGDGCVNKSREAMYQFSIKILKTIDKHNKEKK